MFAHMLHSLNVTDFFASFNYYMFQQNFLLIFYKNNTKTTISRIMYLNYIYIQICLVEFFLFHTAIRKKFTIKIEIHLI